MLTAWGFPGLFLWLAFLGSTFLRLRHLQRRISYAGTWYSIESTAIQSALSGVLVASIFGSYGYGEYIYWLCAMAVSLSRIGESKELAETPPVPSREQGSKAIIRWVGKRQVRKAGKIVEGSEKQP